MSLVSPYRPVPAGVTAAAGARGNARGPIREGPPPLSVVSKADTTPKGGNMGRKLAGLIGILVATLAFGLGSTAAAGHSHSTVRHSQQVLAEDQGPTFVTG
jgi:hypothetical protein